MKGIGKTIRRRRKESKTDYTARFGLLKSGLARLVVRKTNRHVIIQIVKSELAQDKVLYGTSSKVLLSLGWPKELGGSLKSLPACYLTGIVAGKKARELGIETLILDMGMQRNTRRSRIYAAVTGVIQSGVKIPHSKDALPDEKMLEQNPKTRGAFIKLRDKIK